MDIFILDGLNGTDFGMHLNYNNPTYMTTSTISLVKQSTFLHSSLYHINTLDSSLEDNDKRQPEE
ncbi:hypothetical protein BC941DRAFT_470222 [Chlamydoabsidia padenii]|nr:hypothetical protein BC941DRAFT_470222 [Chlamydoabsidia padenii]